MAVVELEALTKFFGTAAAVDDLTLTVAHGSLCCLLGPSGCGKTTTLRLVAGFMDPDRGTIRVGGRPLARAVLRAVGCREVNIVKPRSEERRVGKERRCWRGAES